MHANPNAYVFDMSPSKALISKGIAYFNIHFITLCMHAFMHGTSIYSHMHSHLLLLNRTTLDKKGEFI